MKKVIIILILFSVLVLSAEVKILERSEDRIIMEFDFSDLQIEEGDEFTYFSFSSWSGNEISGAPDLPQRTYQVIIPQNGSMNTSVISLQKEVKQLMKPPVPVPTISGYKETNRFDHITDEEKYQSYYQEFLETGKPSHYRYYDYIPVKINPVKLVNSKKVEIIKNMILQIDISGIKNEQHFTSEPFEKFYQELFINYQSAKYWRSKKLDEINKIPFESSDFWYKVVIDGNAIYYLSSEQLSLLPDFYEPASLRLFTLQRILNDDKLNEYRYSMKEIPLHYDQISDELLFEIDENLLNNIPDRSGYAVWLSFGGNFAGKPTRKDLSQLRSEAVEVNSFTEYERESDTRTRSINCIYVAPQEFLEQTAELAQFHSDFYGLNSIIAEQQDIFDQYSSGIADPVAINNFIEDTWDNLPDEDELKYVSLIGSGTSDWSDPTEKNRLITYDDSDDNFVMFTANFAELIISRIPAQNEEQLDFFLDRLRTYVEEPVGGWWRNKMVLIADDENKDGGLEGYTGGGLDHTNLAQETEDLLNDGFYVDKVLGLEYNFDEYNNKPDARDALIEKINSGGLIWYFIGHGNPDVLGDEDYFRGSQHMRLLDNLSYLPLFLAASCSVGQFDSPSFDCIAERLLFLENGGSIASLAASRRCSGSANTDIMKGLLRKLVNERFTLGDAVYYAKLFTFQVATAKWYNLLGDAVMSILPPIDTGYMTNIPDSIKARELVSIEADLDLDDATNNTGTLRVFDSAYDVFYSNTLNGQTYEVTYSRNGSIYYKGGVDIVDDNFSASFIVPDDIRYGDRGKIINYLYDETAQQDFITYEADISYSSIPADSTSNDLPEVSLWLDSRSFLSGDFVSTSPLLIAEIEDSNGINILGSAGHRILVLLDEDPEPLDATAYFNYHTGSYTTGELQFPLPALEEGFHFLRLIVFDNFNNPTVAETEFKVRSNAALSIEQMLVYPNPIEKDGYFTFIITEDAEIEISIYTITGRKIRTLDKVLCESGYNQIFWDGRDGDGDRIANNTYFYKIKAKQLENGKNTEKIGKLIILK